MAVQSPLRRWFRFIERLAAVSFLLLVFSGCTEFAHDFVLIYAVEANEKMDSGRLDNCDFERICEIRAAGLNIEILVRTDVTGIPTIDMTVRGQPGCCYGADASETFHSAVKLGSLRLAIYRRVLRDRDEFIRNAYFQSERIGTIHLRFSQVH
ncbi:hypothetical protein ACRAVF_01115 [Bradyrhizobium oligotrophicum S58]